MRMGVSSRWGDGAVLGGAAPRGAFTDGTYRTHRTYGSGPISPAGPIGPFRERATGYRASKTHAIAPARSRSHSRSAEIRFPDQGVDPQAFGFVFQDHAARF